MVELVGVASNNLFWGRSDRGQVYAWSGAVAQQISLGERQAVRLRIIDTGAGVDAFVCTRDGAILRFSASGSRRGQVIQGPAEGMIDCAVAGTNNRTYCAWTPERRLYCWGDNTQGQLGSGNDNDTNELMQAVQLSDVIEISAGRDHTCARDNEGSIYCWGDSEHGALGLGGNDRSSPTRIQTF